MKDIIIHSLEDSSGKEYPSSSKIKWKVDKGGVLRAYILMPQKERIYLKIIFKTV